MIPPEQLAEMEVYYEKCAQTLKNRIVALIPRHPEILQMIDPFDLWHIPEFKCSDCDPTLAMVTAALSAAKHEYKNRHTIDSEWEV